MPTTRAGSERRAVVTGAARGIGLAISRRLAEDGGTVAMVDLDGEALREAAASLGDAAVAVPGDVSERHVAAAAVRACTERFGGIDVMVAHAGIAEPTPLLEETDAGWRRHQGVNVDGVFHCTQEAAREMTKAGRGGAIVATASINAFHVEETMAAYNTSKAAVAGFVRSAAIDLARHGIRVNAVAPGVVRTRIAALVTENPELAETYLRTIPLGRFGEPADIASVVAFLSGPDSAYMTGQMLVVDGGQTLGITGSLDDAAAEVGGKGAGG